MNTDCRYHADLIDRQALMRAMYERAFETDGDTMWQSGCWVRYRAIEEVVNAQPSAEPETAKRIVGCARNGMTMWYQCDMCHEPVDEKDAFCRGCGRRFEDG